ncbi:nucleotidyltransferase family protein [Peribacillus castrilensis]|uniref:4-diphosphocytidyl-2C-methyl-D-erythritol synthase n=1 Tax=Peribacillus simplex TaxID=1478 RepID=A0AAN2PGC5_9BACI|nr:MULTISPECIES: nucleotidyltransferase family protein [Bacillaceae]MCP1093395.1 nucleotidyltransferase family protein [Bacillaceae bacterium OS4b]MBD8588649.1 nucleotidyltransferase family protein [Peribacillus simplex]MCF7622082.1 nucleotidyltransferase family protein [Peribacillus frigoritolerans]MCP1152642.1 nucleotidyltransferase family protein [Peribacillus frigoritolerans]MCT1388522.1 nucleotidyltransferase family protein [Peribacillus frigoritolerans]
MEAIVLAAGYSSRANAFKMTLPMGQMSVLEQTISKFEGLCSRVIVVAGFQAEIIQEEIVKIISENAYSFQIKFVYNENFNQGMFHSIQKGCNEVNAPTFFITPGDCPLVKKETVQLLAKHKGNVVIPSFDYKGGHPIKLSSVVKQKILETNPEGNLRVVLGGYEKQYMNVDDAGVLMDVDTPEDYQKAIDYDNALNFSK